jgi:hypothetical protein
MCWGSGDTVLSRFFGITPPQKTNPRFTSSLRDFHLNTREILAAPFHPFMYIQPNTPKAHLIVRSSGKATQSGKADEHDLGEMLF